MHHQRLHKKLKLSHHRHTGRCLPRSETSHGVLLVILLLMGAFIWFNREIVLASSSQSGQVQVAGVVRSPAPSRAAVITQPANNVTSQAQSINVRGVCYGHNIIQLYKNGIFAGSTMCSDNSFSLNIELLFHRNELVAKTVDNLGQYGPDSQPVVVNYAPHETHLVKSRQFLLTSDQPFQAGTASQNFQLNLIAHGGKLPYAVALEWGDDNNEVITQLIEGVVKTSHTYLYGGSYKVKANASDSLGNKSSIEIIVVVNGTPKPTPSAAAPVEEPPTFVSPSLPIVWPLYLLCLLLILFFWMGEKYEYYKLKKQHHA